MTGRDPGPDRDDDAGGDDGGGRPEPWAQVVDDDLDALVHGADLDGLVRMIDDRSSVRDWDGLMRVRDRSRRAVDTGRQLWPAATLAEYRLALHAPPAHVAAVLDETDGSSGRFTIGPLTEVVAQEHTWAELVDHLDPGPRSSFVAHERALRGEVVDDRALAPVLDITTTPAPWEPAYPLATYRDEGAEFPSPELPDDWVELAATPDAELLDDDVDAALRHLVEPWTTSSNGRVESSCVVGGAAEAIGALGVRRARICSLTAPTALAWIAWAGASGGAHGRRRGAAAGRYGTWWLLAALGDLLDDWPVGGVELGELVAQLRWSRWDAFEPDVGWSLRIAVEDPDEHVAWALHAQDASS
ncbi:hypothetical protein [Ilumatobacter sp.]|uniref:hypothetical protein n=1 Tax=Ilumatobacter sp. TaxID=1967498 RepID=UPI003B5290C8